MAAFHLLVAEVMDMGLTMEPEFFSLLILWKESTKLYKMFGNRTVYMVAVFTWGKVGGTTSKHVPSPKNIKMATALF